MSWRYENSGLYNVREDRLVELEEQGEHVETDDAPEDSLDKVYSSHMEHDQKRVTSSSHNTRDNSVNLNWNPISSFALNSFITVTVKLWNQLQLYNWNILSKSSMKKSLPAEIVRRFGNSNL